MFGPVYIDYVPLSLSALTHADTSMTTVSRFQSSVSPRKERLKHWTNTCPFVLYIYSLITFLIHVGYNFSSPDLLFFSIIKSFRLLQCNKHLRPYHSEHTVDNKCSDYSVQSAHMGMIGINLLSLSSSLI